MAIPTIYVITYHHFNHVGPERQPLDTRFLHTDKNYVFYLIDKEIPKVLQGQKTCLEYEIDPGLHEAGGRDFAEWSFLLAEAKHGFCHYPFFMVSSRFYEKNQWLHQSLNEEWERLFKHFDTYGWGYLPSYDRCLSWINLNKYFFFPFTSEALDLTQTLFGIRVLQDYSFISDYLCNYIGFRSRADLLRYVHFYRPVFDTLFDDNYQPRRDISTYVKKTGLYRNEKPFTFYLEFFSHLFFYQEREKFFGLHYDGYYEIDETHRQMKKLDSFEVSLKTRLKRFLRTHWRNLKNRKRR